MSEIFRRKNKMKQKAFLGLCCAIIAAVLFISCGGPEQRKMKFFNKGNAFYEKGDYVRARLEFKNVLQIDPKFARAYHRLGECEIKLKNVKQAFAYMNKAVEYDPQLWEAQLILAQMLFLAGQTDEAKKRVALVLENRPEHTNALLFKSHMLIQENHSDEAEKILKGVIEIDPDNVNGYLALAALLEKTSGPLAAEKILKQGMERNEKSPALLLATAGLYMKRENFIKAESMAAGKGGKDIQDPYKRRPGQCEIPGDPGWILSKPARDRCTDRGIKKGCGGFAGGSQAPLCSGEGLFEEQSD
jgi:tetratricopeptide (TPR) repeat protein